MLEVSELEFRYPRDGFRLRVPELLVRRGETVAVVGPSGSGKTTLLNLAAGIRLAQHGRVLTDGQDLARLSPPRRRRFRICRIGLVFQEFELLDYLTVLDNILLPCRLSSAVELGVEQRERAAELAESLGLGDKLRRRVTRLSQGERQRVAVCRALVLRPPLLLCDEPTGNLDPVNKEHVLEMLFLYVRRYRSTLLTVTHDHNILDRFDRSLDVADFHRKDHVK
jgi:putative ABC transport system ATP-binding protein